MKITPILFVEKSEKLLQKLLSLFQQKISVYLVIKLSTLNELSS